MTNSTAASWISKLVFYLLMLVVLISPLPLGSNREWSWSLLSFLVAGLGLVYAMASFIQPKLLRQKLPATIIVLFLLVCAWVLVQTAGWVPESWYHPIWSMATQALGKPLTGSISVASDDNQLALMRLLAYALVFYLSFQLGQNRKLAYTAIRLFSFAGFAYAIFGLISYWSGSDKLFWFSDPIFTQAVHSSFVNRNSYATYAGLTLLTSIAWLYQSTFTERSNKVYSMPGNRETRIEQLVLKTWMPLTAILLISTALILTSSRGGFASSFIAVLVLLFALNSRQQSRGMGTKILISVVIAVAALAFHFSSEQLMKRMDKIELDGNQRLLVYGLIAKPISEEHYKGFGYGTFSDSFRLYRNADVIGHYDKAHNTYLENIFELGWPAAIGLFASIGWLGLLCYQGIKHRGRDWVYPALGLAATILVAVHATVDFSLQMPAVAVTYAFLLGLGVAQSSSSRA